MPIIGREILRYEQVSSTNDLVRQWGHDGAPEGLVVMAEEQTAGRGRMGRQWIAPKGSSLQFSILLHPPLAPLEAYRLTSVTAIAIAATLRDELRLSPTLKWPNDVLLNEKKCAGILIETVVEGNMLALAILGIGLNVNYAMRDYPDLTPFATTLADELGHPIDRAALEGALLSHLDDYYQRLCAGEDFYAEWRAQLSTLGRRVRVATPDGIEDGIAEDVARDGALLLRCDDRLVRFYAGDVTIVKRAD
ncbi:MAG: biotin--[acetyl-CoA-carboxylase] ligase [Anaerolineae bacterium]